MAVFAPLHKHAAPPPGFYPTRGLCLAAPLLGPRGPGSDPRSPSPRPPWRRSSSLRSASARRRRRGSTRRAARSSPLRFSGPVGPARSPPIPLLNLRVALRARGPVGPAATTPTFGCDHLRGERVLRPRSPPPPSGGDGGGHGPLLASGVLARCGWGRSGTCSYALVAPDVLAVQHSNANRYHPSGDKQVSSDEATQPTRCVIVSRDRGSPDRVDSESK
jgi:hypothetical protein